MLHIFTYINTLNLLLNFINKNKFLPTMEFLTKSFLIIIFNTIIFTYN